MEIISRILEQVDEWRHLPAYQLERRVDVLFGMMLPTVIGEEFGVNPDDCRVIPEFPLHKGKLGIRKNNQSLNVDFAVFFEKENRKHLCLVELKTDQKSIKVGQIETMGQARKAGARKLFVGVIEAAKASKEWRKYAHLIWKLHEIGCVNLSDIDGFKKMQVEKRRPGPTGYASQLKKAKVRKAWSDAEIDLIAIVPRKLEKEKNIRAVEKEEFRHLTFDQFTGFLRKAAVQPFGVEFAETFARFLDRWNTVVAGEKPLGE